MASPLPAPSPYTGPTGGLAERREPLSRPASPVRTARTSCRVPRQCPSAVPGTHQMTLRPSTTPQHVPLPSPPTSSLTALADPESDSLRAASPTVTRLLATAVTDPSFESAAASALVAELVNFTAHCCLDYAASLVAKSESACPPSVGGECALGTDILEDRQEEFQCFATALPHLVSMMLAPEENPDAPDIPTLRSYAEAIEGPYSSQWQAAMDAEMASWKSTGTYVDEVPPPGANIRQGVDYFHTFSPTPKMTTIRVLLHVAAQRDYELHSLDFSTAFLQGSLHEEIWLRRPPGFTGSFPPGAQWSLRRPVYDLRRAPREWHNTLRTTLAALGFAPSTADPSLFLRTDTLLPPFYILVYVGNLVFATADIAGLAHVKSELQKRHTCTDLELVGCLMYLMTCTRPDLAYPLSILARYVAPGRHRPEHMAAAKRVLRYLCSTSGMGLVLGGRSPVVLTGHADASWVDDLATQRSSQGYTFSLGSGSVSWRSTRSSSVLSSSCEDDIYAGAMAAQELRWLTYLLTDLGEPPRSPPVLYVDNKAMLALCRKHRLEHRTKHIALHYFLARELQQRGQLRLAYVASQANTADIFTKALQPCAACAGAAGGAACAGAAGGAARTGDPRAEGTGSVSAVSGGTARSRPYYVSLLQQVLGSLPSPGPPPPLLSPPPVQSPLQFQPASPLPSLSPYSGPTRGLTERREPESRPVSPESRSAPDIPTPRSYAEAIEGPYSSQWQAAMDTEMASWNSTGTYVDEVPPPGANIVSGMWIFRVKRPPGSPTVFKARYVARGFSPRQGVDFFQTFSPTPKMTTLRVLLHVAAQRDYELHSLDFSTAFLQGSLHEEIWLRRPPGFTGSFPAGTQWSLRRPVYGLGQAPREWHDTLRTILAALGFAPSSSDPSLFLRTNTTLPPFYVLVYVDDLVFATADTEALAHVKSEVQKRHTCTDLGELTSYLGLRITRDRAQRTMTLTQSHMVQQVLQRFGFTYSSPQSTPLPTGHSLSAPPSDESVEPSGPYPELVGCL
ncbi:unnamed protein product, partial [Closterium sp. NIES-54]